MRTLGHISRPLGFGGVHAEMVWHTSETISLNTACNLGLEVKALAAASADNFNGNAGPIANDRGAELAEHGGHGVRDRNNDTSEKVSPRPVCPSRRTRSTDGTRPEIEPANEKP
jgi:hypothetical protein